MVQKLLSHSRPDICHFFSINVLLGSIFLHIGEVFYITHVPYVENFKFLHMSCGDIWNFSTCGEIFNFPTIVIHGKLKFLHMTFFSSRIWFLIFVTNMSSDDNFRSNDSRHVTQHIQTKDTMSSNNIFKSMKKGIRGSCFELISTAGALVVVTV